MQENAPIINSSSRTGPLALHLASTPWPHSLWPLPASCEGQITTCTVPEPFALGALGEKENVTGSEDAVARVGNCFRLKPPSCH